MFKHITWPVYIFLPTCMALHGIQEQAKAIPAIAITGALVAHSNNERMIFSNDGTRILAATQDNPSDVVQYRNDNHQLIPTAHQPLHTSEAARLLNALTLIDPEGYRILHTSSYEYHINNIHIRTGHYDNKKECARVRFNSPLSDDALIACTELDKEPLVAYYRPKENIVGVVSSLSGQTVEALLPKLQEECQVQQLSFSCISNTGFCILTRLLKSPQGVILHSTKVFFDEQKKIDIQMDFDVTRMRRRHPSHFLPKEHAPSIGWSPTGEHSVLVHRLPNRIVAKSVSTGCSFIIPTTAYHIVADVIQNPNHHARVSKEFTIFKHITSINKTDVQVSPDSKQAIFDGMLVNLQEYTYHHS